MPKRRTLPDTVNDLSQVTGFRDLDKVDPKIYGRLSRDKRLSKELQAAARNFPKVLKKYHELRKTLGQLAEFEKEALINSGYAKEIEDAVQTIMETLSTVKVSFKGKSKYIDSYLEISENVQNYRLRVYFNFNKFEKDGWGYRGRYSKYTQSTLDEQEQDQLLVLIRNELKKAFEISMPGFVSSLGQFDGPNWLASLGYGFNNKYGGHWALKNQHFINYLRS